MPHFKGFAMINLLLLFLEPYSDGSKKKFDHNLRNGKGLYNPNVEWEIATLYVNDPMVFIAVIHTFHCTLQSQSKYPVLQYVGDLYVVHSHLRICAA